MRIYKKKLLNIYKIISAANRIYDIDIDGNKYIWNSQPVDWINSENSINEIGSIHTTQGFDLNYTGLIIGNELKYDNENNCFVKCSDSSFINSRYIVSFKEVKNIETRGEIKVFK